MIAVRGATTVQEDTLEEVRKATIELMSELISQNNLTADKMISVLFTATMDIRSAYPGRFLREDLGFHQVPILHFQEMEVEGSLRLCIRVMIYYADSGVLCPVYLHGAKALRPDITK